VKFYVQKSALDRLARIGHKMDSAGKQTAQISIGPGNGFVEVAPVDDGKCGECPSKPNPERENYEMVCGECKRFYADLKVKP
jgi:hypothetical protein